MIFYILYIALCHRVISPGPQSITDDKIFLIYLPPGPHCSVGSAHDLKTDDRWFDLRAQPRFFPRIDDSHFDKIGSSLTAVHYFDDGYVGNHSGLERSTG